MTRQKKEAKALNIRLESGVMRDLEKFCDETGVSKTTATEKILRQYLDEYFSKPEKDRKLF